MLAIYDKAKAVLIQSKKANELNLKWNKTYKHTCNLQHAYYAATVPAPDLLSFTEILASQEMEESVQRLWWWCWSMRQATPR